jgi:hypothetical protein
MRGSSLKGLLAALAFGAAMTATAAIADDEDDYRSLMADCNRPDLPLSDINGCMERARVLDESRPSPQLQHLLTQLERRSEEPETPNSDKPSSSPASAAPHSLVGASVPPADQTGHKDSGGLFAFLGFGSGDGDSAASAGQPAATDTPHALPGATPVSDKRPREYEAPVETAPAAEYEGGPTTAPKDPSHG